MSTIKRIKRGFTLAEVLVTVAIIAIMAAVILPALNQQLAKGDTSRITSDLTNVQSAIQAFVSDMRRFPASTDQLISGASGTDILGNAYSASDAAAWKGPYIARDVISHTGGRATISPTFSLVTQSGTSFLTINLSPITESQFENLELALDEGTTSTTSTTLGVIRYSSPSSTLSFFAMPVR